MERYVGTDAFKEQLHVAPRGAPVSSFFQEVTSVLRRISNNTLGVLVLAIAVGFAGAYGVRQMLLAEPPPVEEAEPVVETLPIASIDLPADRVIRPGDISVRKNVPRKRLEEKGVPVGMLLTRPEFAVGRRVKTPIKAGEPIVSSTLYLEGDGPSLVDQLKDGERMVTIPVAPTKGGLVPVDSLVDVLFRTIPRRGDAERPAIPEMTITLLENVRVLDAVPHMNKPTLVTLAVAAENVEKVEVVEDHGEFSLVVRANEDYDPLSTSGDAATLEDVLGIKPAPPAPEKAPLPVMQTQVYLGAQAGANTFVDRGTLAGYEAVHNGTLAPWGNISAGYGRSSGGRGRMSQGDCATCKAGASSSYGGGLRPISDPIGYR